MNPREEVALLTKELEKVPVEGSRFGVVYQINQSHIDKVARLKFIISEMSGAEAVLKEFPPTTDWKDMDAIRVAIALARSVFPTTPEDN